ncbi:MAG: ATP-grasp domain-containing protein [Terriglobales bacterium]
MNPTLVFVDDRPSPLLDALTKRTDLTPVLLRFSNALSALPREHLIATKHLPTFVVNADLDAAAEAARFRTWMAAQGQPVEHFCNSSELRQDIAQNFARRAGLPALTAEQVMWVRDKSAMKQKLRDIGFRVAAHAVVMGPNDVTNFASHHGWPVVVKPRDGFACIGTHLVNSEKDLMALGLLDQKPMVVEAYQHGIEYELCALFQHGRVLAAFLSSMPERPLAILDGAVNANITFREVPCDFPVQPYDVAQAVISGFGLKDGYLHSEFFLHSGRLTFGEVAARLAGGLIPRNHSLAFGYDVFDALLDIHVGRVPDLVPTQFRFVGDLLLPAPAGRITKITTANELLERPEVLAAFMWFRPGDVIEPRRHSHFSSGGVHVSGNSVDEVEARMRQLLDDFEIETELAPEPSK